jgi:hypothetical protein
MWNLGGRPIDPRKLVGYLFVAGMVLAPFLALVYGLNIGLGVMTLALAATTYIAFDLSRTVDLTQQPRVRTLAIATAALALLCLAVLLVRAL